MKQKEFEITFQSIQSYFIEAESEEKAIEQAWLVLEEHLEHNSTSLFDIQSIIREPYTPLTPIIREDKNVNA
jgi:hypothetical protein